MENRYKFPLFIPATCNEYTVNKINFNKPEDKGQWKSEALCRRVFEDMFGMEFPSVRLNCLKNPETNRNLELDGYNEELGLAFEYSGIQHYQYPNPFHTSEEQFINQVRRDQYKREKFDEMGIYLITIPYNVPVKYEEIKDYIIYHLPQNKAIRDAHEQSL